MLVRVKRKTTLTVDSVENVATVRLYVDYTLQLYTAVICQLVEIRRGATPLPSPQWQTHVTAVRVST